MRIKLLFRCHADRLVTRSCQFLARSCCKQMINAQYTQSLGNDSRLIQSSANFNVVYCTYAIKPLFCQCNMSYKPAITRPVPSESVPIPERNSPGQGLRSHTNRWRQKIQPTLRATVSKCKVFKSALLTWLWQHLEFALFLFPVLAGLETTQVSQVSQNVIINNRISIKTTPSKSRLVNVSVSDTLHASL